MNRNNGFSVYASRRALKYIILSALLAIFVMTATGCPNETKEEAEQNARDEIERLCKTRVESWLNQNEPGATWNGTVTIETYDAGTESQYSDQQGIKPVRAASGTFKRSDNTEISFLYALDGIGEGPVMIRTMYVSRLPVSQEKEILDSICISLPLAHQATGLRAGNEIYIPFLYESAMPGYSSYYSVEYKLKKNGLERKLLPAGLNAEALDTQVTIAIFAGLNENQANADDETKLRQKEMLDYEEQTWRNQLLVEITLTDDDFAENEPALLSWVISSDIRAAVITDKSGITWTIRRTYHFEPGEDSNAYIPDFWKPCYSVSRGNDDEIGKTGDVRYYYKNGELIEP